MVYKILVTESMAKDGPVWLKEHGYEVKYARGIEAKTLIEDLQDCDGVIPRLAVMSDDVISQCPRLKVIARHGAGVDTVDLESCKRHGVRVVNSVGSNTIAVSEHAIMLILACAKSLNIVQGHYRSGNYALGRKNTVAVELYGKTLGLIGMGHIGSNVARMVAKGFGMRVLVYDPYLAKGRKPEYVTLVENRDQVFKESDFISIHMPVTPQTKNSIGAAEFGMMKPKAYIVNTARGTIIDEPALIDALISGKIAGAGLDVANPEPAELSNPLFTLSNVILTPHCAGSTLESKARSSLGAAKGCDEILTGKNPTSLVL